MRIFRSEQSHLKMARYIPTRSIKIKKSLVIRISRLATNQRRIFGSFDRAKLNSVIMVCGASIVRIFLFRAPIADPEHVPASLATLSRARAVSRVTYLVTRKSSALVHIKASHNTSRRKNRFRLITQYNNADFKTIRTRYVNYSFDIWSRILTVVSILCVFF